MKMDYASNNCEKRAHELLAPLAGICPDSVWESVCVELETKRAEANSKWLNKLSSSPKIPLVAAGSLALVIISSWMFLTHKSVQSNSSIASSVPVKSTVAPTPKPSVNSSASIVPAVPVKKDSVPVVISPVQATIPISNQPLVKNDRHLKQNDSLKNRPVIPQTSGVKEDTGPMVIHTSDDGVSQVTTVMPTSKGVAIDLNKKDADVGTQNILSQPSAERVTTVADSAQ